MKNTLTMVALSAGILTAGCSKRPKSDSVVLQGTWTGKEAGAQSEGSPSLALEGTNCEFHGENLKEWYKGTFSLREDAAPKQLDVVITECSFPQFVGKTVHAIYKIEDGKLTLAGNAPGVPKAPVNFDAPGARKFVFPGKK